MNNAIYVVDLGKKDEPRCRMAQYVQEDVPQDAAFALLSPNR